MPYITYTPDCESKCPHSPDVGERNIAENGFAAGWAPHGKPQTPYWFDCHIHSVAKPGDDILATIQPDLALLADQEVERAFVMIELNGPKWKRKPAAAGVMDQFASFTIDQAVEATRTLVEDGRHVWAPYLHYLNADAELVGLAAQAGARGVKIHNAPQIEEAAPADVWLGADWQAAFGAMADCKLPVLWHVTQRLPNNAYTGGGRNTYWTKGWENGVTYGNEELLQVFLRCLERNPGVPFIGAHQLHIGWERLDRLFTGHPNLYVDTTVGCTLKEHDTFYPADKEFLRAVFIKWADRILYGTDGFWGHGRSHADSHVRHMRFVQHLDLPGDVLNKIAHGNTERLLKLENLL